jgi:peptidoglycan hydrolase CwlO-like protein
VLEEPEREKELIEKIESLDSELEIAQNESLSLSSEVESLSKLLKDSEKEIQQMKDNLRIQQEYLK